MILYFASDLIWATRIKSTADELAITTRPVRNLDMLRDRLAESRIQALILDLDAPDTALTLLQHLPDEAKSTQKPAVYVLAFGPHVATDRFESAANLGADEVMTRGAFASKLPEILRRLNDQTPLSSGHKPS